VSEFFKKVFFYFNVAVNSTSNSFIQIIEHEKSGGTWLARLLASYYSKKIMSSRRIQWTNWNSVVRLHNRHQYTYNNLSKQLYMLRDGRDVLTSYYFHLFYRLQIIESQNFQNIEDIKKNMPKYLDLYFNKKLGNKNVWHSHVLYWLPKIKIVVRYEDLLNNTYETLKNLIEKIDNNHAVEFRLNEAIHENNFKKLAKRERGKENRMSSYRKGIIGDWENYFNKESARIFNDYAGTTLVNLGYEKDDSWIYRC